MSSVTQRIKEVKQPRGGYIRPSQMKQETIDDGKVLNQEENVHATLIGLTVDYMTRVMLNNGEVFPAFDIALHGADNASIMGFFEARNILDSLLCNIKGLDDESIISACKACTFDVWYRNPDMAPLAKRYNEINPDEKTVANLRIMINRSLDFYAKYGPVIKDGLTFEPNGYTKTVSAGDGDFLTADTLWDFKVSKAEPTSKYTLQLAMYYIMGKHSGQEIYNNIYKIGIFNPRLNKIYTLDMNEVSDEVIRTIENEVICYMPYTAVDEVE